MKKNDDYLMEYAQLCREADKVDQKLFDEYDVQRGLRDKNGNGVLTGLTNISRIESFKMEDGKKVPCEVPPPLLRFFLVLFFLQNSIEINDFSSLFHIL